jgi:hypothetical protein
MRSLAGRWARILALELAPGCRTAPDSASAVARSHERQVTLRCDAAPSRRSDHGPTRGLRAAADALRAIEITKAATSFMPSRSAGRRKNCTRIEFCC